MDDYTIELLEEERRRVRALRRMLVKQSKELEDGSLDELVDACEVFDLALADHLP